MSDELEQQDNPTEEKPSASDQTAAPSAETKITENNADHMIPKSRFDEVNERLKTLTAAQEKAAAEREAAERKQLEEQSEFKKLYEEEVKARETAVAEMKALRIKNLRHQIANTVGLPDGLADRLQGDDEESIKADAEALLKTLPKPSAAKLDGGAGKGGKGKPNAPTWAEIKEQAARYGVNPKHLAQQYGVTPPA